MTKQNSVSIIQGPYQRTNLEIQIHIQDTRYSKQVKPKTIFLLAIEKSKNLLHCNVDKASLSCIPGIALRNGARIRFIQVRLQFLEIVRFYRDCEILEIVRFLEIG